ncbi:MAG: YfhO family protein [Acidobacteria bacterium]|nr:YfhO family protein [Acidobacteriota bacterium]
MRDQVSFEQLTAYSMTLRDALGAVYPMVVHEGREVPVYVGLPVLLLAGVGLTTARGNWRVWFWAIVAVIAVLLALGVATPVARLAYHIPLYDKFRILSRHLVFATFGVITLASFGLAALPRIERPGRRVMASACVLAGIMAAGFWMLWTERAGEVESHTWALLTEGYFQTTVPLQLTFFVATVTVALLLARIRSRAASVAAIVFVAILGADLLGSQFVEITSAGFRFPHLVPPSVLQPSVHTAWLRDELTAAGQRVVALHGSASDPVVGGQFAKVWRVRSASGYNSMLLTHFNALSTIGKQGDVNPQALRPDDVGLDLMGTRYLVAQTKLIDAEETFQQDGYQWSEEPLRLAVGQPKCGASQPSTLRLSPQTQGVVSAIAFVGYLRCAEDTAQGTNVGAVRLIAADGTSQEHPLRAGIDLSEAAHQRADVRDRVKHARARPFGDSTDDESRFLVTVVLKSPIEIEQIELTQSVFAGWMVLDRLTLVGIGGTQLPQSFVPLMLNDETRWREVRRFRTSLASDRGRDEDAENEQEFVVIENRRAMPRAWIANRVLAISETDQGEAMRQSILPDGTRFDPIDTALVSPEDPPAGVNGAPHHRRGQVRAVAGANGNVRIDVEGDGGFLVLNDIWYPGWEARIDGAAARLHRANIAMMGVVVPSGTHRVEFAFVPWSKVVGAWLSAAAGLVLVGVTLVRPIGRRIGLQTA